MHDPKGFKDIQSVYGVQGGRTHYMYGIRLEKTCIMFAQYNAVALVSEYEAVVLLLSIYEDILLCFNGALTE